MQCRYTEIAQRIFKYSDTQYIGLTLDKELNSLIYRTLFDVNIYGSYKLSKNNPVFLAHPVVSATNYSTNAACKRLYLKWRMKQRSSDWTSRGPRLTWASDNRSRLSVSMVKSLRPSQTSAISAPCSQVTLAHSRMLPQASHLQQCLGSIEYEVSTVTKFHSYSSCMARPALRVQNLDTDGVWMAEANDFWDALSTWNPRYKVERLGEQHWCTCAIWPGSHTDDVHCVPPHRRR